ncbi:MAG: hypothetical protein IJH68_03670 [Thermoguttaceae bacterium]|nr:hypothetical protein [Thermoguttaceae bacterium]
MSVHRGRQRAETAEVSLFPFLAVLLCTMGILIMLLVLIGQNTAERYELAAEAGEKSAPVPKSAWEEKLFDFPQSPEPAEPPAETDTEEAPAESQTTPAVEDSAENNAEDDAEKARYAEARQALGDLDLEGLKTEVESAVWFRGELQQVHDRTGESLKSARQALSQTEAQIARQVEHLADLQNQLRALEEDSGGDAEAAAAAIEEKKAAIEALNSEIEELKKKAEQQGENRSYAILPYKGKNGTFRRPIYVECTASGVTLMPENFFFPMDDLILGKYPGNPFDTGLRTARQYYIDTGQGSEEDEPYPLLIVRPDGSESYYAARGALASWGGECGYEFIEEDAQIEYPAASPELAQKVQDQVVVARGRMAGTLAMLRQQMEMARQRELAASGSGSGGFSGSGGGFSSGPGTGGFGGSGSGGGLGDQLGPYARLSSGGSEQPSGTMETFGGAGSADGGTPGGMSADGIPGGGEQITASYRGSFGASAGGEAPLPPMEGTTADGAAGGLMAGFPDTSGYGIGGYGAAGDSGGTEGDGTAAGGMAGSQGTAGSEDMAASEGAAAQDGAMRQGGAASAAVALTGAGGIVPAAPNASDAPYLSDAPNVSADGQIPGSLTAQMAAQGQTSPDPGEPKEGEAIDPSVTVGNTAYYQSELERMQSKGLTESKPQGQPGHESVKSAPISPKAFNLNEQLHKTTEVAVERPILVECHPDGIVFPRQNGVAQRTEIAWQQGCENEILRTIIACVQSWKVAGRNRYWTPWISASVAPGAEGSYQRLANLMTSQKVKIQQAQ